jgi:hypothetical protein
MESLQSQMLQKQLFRNILTRVQIITKLDPELHFRILQCWSNSLFCSFRDHAKEFWDTDSILALLRSFYWYDPRDTLNHVQYRKPNLNASTCRFQLLRILSSYFIDSFNQKDFLSLISHCIGAVEIEQSEELLNLLVKTVRGIHDSIRFNIEGTELISLIHFFLGFPLVRLQRRAIEFFVVCDWRELVSDRFCHSIGSDDGRVAESCANSRNVFDY